MTALAKAQGQIGDIERDRTVTVQPRNGNAYQFKYATLSNIIKGIKKALSDNGIAYTQVLTYSRQDSLYYLTTNLHHKNQFISSITPLIISDAGGNQQFGSALTYMKRYALAALVGVAADEDDDGNVADGNEVKSLQTNAPKPPAPDVIERSLPPGLVAQVKAHQEDIKYNAWVPTKIDVPLLPDESGSDWMTWGKTYITEARKTLSIDQLDALQKANEAPLKNMEISAPKMYANLGVSLLKTRKELEKKS